MDDEVKKAMTKDQNQRDIIKYVEHHFGKTKSKLILIGQCSTNQKLILASKNESLQMMSEIGLLSMATAIIEKRAIVVSAAYKLTSRIIGQGHL